MVIFAEGEDELRRGLGVLDEWCREWGMKVNADKCGVMHIRRRSVRRTMSAFSVGGDMVRVVQSYKYLGCIVNEQMDSMKMVGDRANIGRGALSAWLWRCRVSVWELKGRTSVKLWRSWLGHAVLMYGAEVWGCCRQLDHIEQIYTAASLYRIFLGVGRLHPKTFLQIEMGVLPLRWEAEIRCIEFCTEL